MAELKEKLVTQRREQQQILSRGAMEAAGAVELPPGAIYICHQDCLRSLLRQPAFMIDIPFRRELAFAYGHPDRLSPLVRRVIARNPSPFTFHGTGTYIIGHGSVAVIDPGPDLAEHRQALLDSLRGERVTHILITHTHEDHCGGAQTFQAAVDAPIYGFGPIPPLTVKPSKPVPMRVLHRTIPWQRAICSTVQIGRYRHCIHRVISPITSASPCRPKRRFSQAIM